MKLNVVSYNIIIILHPRTVNICVLTQNWMTGPLRMLGLLEYILYGKKEKKTNAVNKQ